jgi:hypothetical protein
MVKIRSPIAKNKAILRLNVIWLVKRILRKTKIHPKRDRLDATRLVIPIADIIFEFQ